MFIVNVQCWLVNIPHLVLSGQARFHVTMLTDTAIYRPFGKNRAQTKLDKIERFFR